MKKIDKIPPGSGGYKIIHEKKYKDVHPSRQEIADIIDVNGNKILEDKEINSYLKKEDILKDPKFFKVNKKRIIDDFKISLQGLPPQELRSYHSYEDVVKKLKQFETEFPNLAKVVKLGATHEGREMLALKITKDAQSDTADKPGIVITGLHHAREWISLEVPLHTAEQMLSGYESNPEMKKRIDNAEIWIVPVVNPDGYEYSRNEYSFWRKNRKPVVADPCGKSTNAIGTDLNRNYYDANEEHQYLYRPPGDTPCSTWDDFGQTSDNPKNDTYRGSAGSSEAETKAMLGLELNRKNIKGIIDYHSYGSMILYPWGYTKKTVENLKEYTDMANGMKNAMKNPYKVMQSVSLYPTSGSSEDCHHVNGKMSFTIELGNTFQPAQEEIIPICQNLLPANLYFIDKIIEKYSK